MNTKAASMAAVLFLLAAHSASVSAWQAPSYSANSCSADRLEYAQWIAGQRTGALAAVVGANRIAADLSGKKTLAWQQDQVGAQHLWAFDCTTPAPMFIRLTSDQGIGRHQIVAASEDLGGDRCFVELLPSGDLYVPDVGGMAAYLELVGEYRWRLAAYYPGGDTGCDVVTLNGADVKLTDIRTYPGERWRDARLESTGADTWVLRCAEQISGGCDD